MSIGGRLIPNGQLTIVFDNEPRNGEIVKQIEKMIDKGRKVVLWPDNVEEKDINDMILSGMTKENIQEIIKQNTFSTAEAKLRFAELMVRLQSRVAKPNQSSRWKKYPSG